MLHACCVFPGAFQLAEWTKLSILSRMMLQAQARVGSTAGRRVTACNGVLGTQGFLSQEHNKKNIREGNKKQNTMYVYYILYSHDVGCAATSNTPCRARLKKEKKQALSLPGYVLHGLLCCCQNRDFSLPAVKRPVHTRQRGIFVFLLIRFAERGAPRSFDYIYTQILLLALSLPIACSCR